MAALEIFILVRCDEKTEKKQKLEACRLVETQIKNINGVERTYSPLTQEADITAFARCEETKISQLIEEIKRIDGVKEVEVKIFATA